MNQPRPYGTQQPIYDHLPASGRGSATLVRMVRCMRANQGHAEQFWQIFETSRVPMVMVDNERRYLAANAPARFLFRLSQAEMVKRRIDDLTAPERLDLVHGLWARLMRDGVIAGTYEACFPMGNLRILHGALANALPGQHLIVFVPADWSEDELLDPVEDRRPSRRALSRREHEVLSLIAAGADQQEIAHELTIAIPTVRTHVRNLLRKLGARNRAHAIALAMQDGTLQTRSSRPARRAHRPEPSPRAACGSP